jgi:hypothetical protein
MEPNVVGSRERWELYIVTYGVMVAACHNIQLPSFSASHDIRHHLCMFISDSPMMAF